MLKCGLLGKKLGHSYSPAIHARLGDYSYGLFEKEEAELEDFLKNGDWDGLNVTIPYKKTVLPYCAQISDIARETGSVIREPVWYRLRRWWKYVLTAGTPCTFFPSLFPKLSLPFRGFFRPFHKSFPAGLTSLR